MEAVYLWVDGKTRHQIREAEFTYFWNTMPKSFKAPFLEGAEKVDALDMISFASVMSHFWHDGEWHEEPEDMESLRRGDLCGGHISTVRKLGDLFEESKFKH